MLKSKFLPILAGAAALALFAAANDAAAVEILTRRPDPGKHRGAAKH
jgi:hypothetical protein